VPKPSELSTPRLSLYGCREEDMAAPDGHEKHS
jgi:hypothetical protein